MRRCYCFVEEGVLLFCRGGGCYCFVEEGDAIVL